MANLKENFYDNIRHLWSLAYLLGDIQLFTIYIALAFSSFFPALGVLSSPIAMAVASIFLFGFLAKNLYDIFRFILSPKNGDVVLSRWSFEFWKELAFKFIITLSLATALAGCLLCVIPAAAALAGATIVFSPVIVPALFALSFLAYGIYAVKDCYDLYNKPKKSPADKRNLIAKVVAAGSSLVTSAGVIIGLLIPAVLTALGVACPPALVVAVVVACAAVGFLAVSRNWGTISGFFSNVFKTHKEEIIPLLRPKTLSIPYSNQNGSTPPLPTNAANGMGMSINQGDQPHHDDQPSL